MISAGSEVQVFPGPPICSRRGNEWRMRRKKFGLKRRLEAAVWKRASGEDL